MAEKKKESMGKSVHSPSGREQTIQNSGGMPETWGVEKTFKEATPPKRYASDSTDSLGKE